MMLTATMAANSQTAGFRYTDEAFADIQMLRYKVEGFEKLTLRQKTLVYYLSEAALQGRDILFDQNGRYNLRIRRMLETVYTQYRGDRNSKDFRELTTYLKRVWFASGIHHHYVRRSSNRASRRNGSARLWPISTTRSTRKSSPSSSIRK